MANSDRHLHLHRRNYSTGSHPFKPTVAQVAAAAAARQQGTLLSQSSRPWGENGSPSGVDVVNGRKQSIPIDIHPAAAAASAAADEAWKIVGSPPRPNRFSYSVPQSPERNGTDSLNSEADDSDDLVLSRKRGIRTRAASNPTPLMMTDNQPISPEITVSDSSEGQAPGNWTSLGMGWGNQNSIWKDNGTANSVSSGGKKESDYLSPEITPAPRQYRSFSFSLATMQGVNGFDDGEGNDYNPDRITQQPLRGDGDDEYNHFSLPKIRSRSKSSSAIYGLLSNQDTSSYDVPSSPTSKDGDYADINSIWSVGAGSQQEPLRQNHEPSLLHRRASTQPSHGLMWGAQESNGALSPDNRYRSGRRFSHQPMYNDYPTQLINRSSQLGSEADYAYDLNRRRHSVAGPLYGDATSSRYLSEALDALHIDHADGAPFLDEIDDYFENTEHRTRAWVEAGKNLQMQHHSNHFPLYVVEFKAGRTDFFYVQDAAAGQIKKGDLAIVEADRGKDLGKVIFEGIQNPQQLALYQAQHGDVLVGENGSPRDVHPKRIFRLAQAGEIAMLVSKSQDEAKAMGVCQAKIRQKKLPMEIVDAEYQWDRRKLTFYFVADRRIDFRELVRDLFKIYKTRIWMCAVHPMKPPGMLKK